MSAKKYSKENNFDFGKFWNDFNSAASGMWSDIARTFLSGSAVAALDKSSAVDCPFPERHGKSGGKKKMRTKASFDSDGMYFCSCGHKSVLDMLVQTGEFGTKYAAAEAIVSRFSLAVELATDGKTNRKVSEEDRARLERDRQAREAQRQRELQAKEKDLAEFLSKTWNKDLHEGITRAAELYLKRRHLSVDLMACSNCDDIKFGRLMFNGGKRKYVSHAMGSVLRCQTTLECVGLQRTYFDEHGVPLKEKGEEIYKMATPLYQALGRCAQLCANLVKAIPFMLEKVLRPSPQSVAVFQTVLLFQP